MNTVHSCTQHYTVTVRLTVKDPDSIIPLSKTLALLQIHLQLQTI